ncbi:pyridoxal phosphate-dependent aminotransferase [Bartonella sp. M0177]|uniref:pyridoxal phosphate-dependent aminotransferase n=1 Tax=Bartonella sp. M0177 TaxID=2750940 RepID=UPI0018DB4DFE|nr:MULTISPECIES: pyridoxal phosphate-dependent aminotransferase [Bartonella]MBI0002813.1 pyridoxal phosphate-dependent aminotransferase [Bartonella sp. M0177]WLT08848.1 pyridoxal phosphate-dependent aminotransferase [Bartonella apihabitans]
MMTTLKIPEPRAVIKSLDESLIREVANTAMGQKDIIPFWFGESDQVTPKFIRDAAITSINNGETFYSQNLGRPYLREAISQYMRKLHEKSVPIQRIAAIDSGVSGLMLTMQMLLDPGDKMVAVTPIWPNITEIPKILGAHVERVPLAIKNNRWALDTEQLLKVLTPNTKLLVINSPNNPTGWTINDNEIDMVLAHCRKYGIWILADDVYERLIHDKNRKSAPSFISRFEDGDRIISVNSFSKAWNMTGWRLGWITAPEEIIKNLSKVIEYNASCIFEPVQRAGATALENGEDTVAEFRLHLRKTRKLLVDNLMQIPRAIVPEADGAMYVFFRLEDYDDTVQLAKDLIRNAGIGLAPGGAFGAEGNGWLRWCHAVETDKLNAGIARLKKYLDR